MPSSNFVVEEAIEMELSRQGFVRRPVEVPEDSELDGEFREAIERLAGNGKSAIGIFAFTKRSLKLQIAAITVSGLVPDSVGIGGMYWRHSIFERRQEALSRVGMRRLSK